MEDPALVDHLRSNRIPLTICPSSNVRLRVFPTLAESNIGEIIKAGLTVRFPHAHTHAYAI
jgi:adenosine deaminase